MVGSQNVKESISPYFKCTELVVEDIIELSRADSRLRNTSLMNQGYNLLCNNLACFCTLHFSIIMLPIEPEQSTSKT